MLPQNRDILLCPAQEAWGSKGEQGGKGSPTKGSVHLALILGATGGLLPEVTRWQTWAAADGPALPPFSLQQGKSSSTGNLLDKDDIAIPPPDYGMSSQAFPSQNVNTFKQRPYSVAVPAFSQVSPDCPHGFSGAGGGFFKNGRCLSEPQSLDLCWSVQLLGPTRVLKQKETR